MRRVAAAAAAVLAIAAISAGIVLAAGGPDGAPAHALEVELDEWRLLPSGDTLAAGPVRLSQRNTGREEHELLIVRTDLPADDLPRGLEGVSPAAAGKVVYGAAHSHHRDVADNHHLAPGASKSEQIRLRPGRYVLLCSIPGHYEAGQRTTLRVE